MNRHIVIRPLADQHLDEQARYVASHSGIAMGRRFYEAAEETFTLLADESEIGKRTHYRNHFLKNTRVFPMKTFENHLIFYKPHSHVIEILDIVHGARDIENLY